MDPINAIRPEKCVHGTFGYRDKELCVALVMAAQLDFSRFTTYPPTRGAEIFYAFMNGDSTPIKEELQP